MSFTADTHEVNNYKVSNIHALFLWLTGTSKHALNAWLEANSKPCAFYNPHISLYNRADRKLAPPLPRGQMKAHNDYCAQQDAFFFPRKYLFLTR